MHTTRSDPSGNYGAWKATAIGANNKAATSILVSEFNATLTVQEALKLAVKVLAKSMDTTSPTADKMEFTMLQRDPTTGSLTQSVMSEAAIQVMLDEIQAQGAGQADV